MLEEYNIDELNPRRNPYAKEQAGMGADPSANVHIVLPEDELALLNKITTLWNSQGFEIASQEVARMLLSLKLHEIEKGIEKQEDGKSVYPGDVIDALIKFGVAESNVPGVRAEDLFYEALMEELLAGYSYSATRMDEEDGSVTLSLKEFDLAENGRDEEDARMKLASAILEYAEEFYEDFAYWESAPNRRALPYVFKALLMRDAKKLGESIRCQAGKFL